MNVNSLALCVQKYIQQRLPQYVEELRELCSIDSGSQYKPGLDEMAMVLAARLRGIGMETTIIEHEHWGNDLVSVVRGEGAGKVLLLGHTDTVYPVGTAAERPLRVEENIIYGPGVSDMKGCVLSAIYAIEAMQALGYCPFEEIRFLCISDEEIPERHSEDMVQEACQECDAALVLESPTESGDLVSARKGVNFYTLRAQGRSSHAGVEPEKGRNAIRELAHQITQLQSLDGWCEGLTINATHILGGTARNVVPDYAEVVFDVRYLYLQDKFALEERWRQMLQQHSIPEVELSLESSLSYLDPMICTPESLKMVETAQDIAKTLGFSLNHVRKGGGSDGRYPSRCGVPVLDGLAPIGGLDHSPNEYLRLDTVADRAALLAGLIASVEARKR